MVRMLRVPGPGVVPQYRIDSLTPVVVQLVALTAITEWVTKQLVVPNVSYVSV